MSTTARLSLPYIAPQQAQKQVTYNAAMALLDQLRSEERRRERF